MIYYYGNEKDFSHFANDILNYDSNASIIVIDPEIFETPSLILLSDKDTEYLRSLERVNVILVESLLELFELLESTIRGEPNILTSTETKILGFYGVFLFIFKSKLGDGDYSAQSLNALFNLFYNLSFYRGMRIYITDNGNGSGYKNGSVPLIWNFTLPNTKNDSDSVKQNGEITEDKGRKPLYVPFRLVISKWIQEII